MRKNRRIDPHYAHAKTCAVEILATPETHVFGERQYTARDPAGHRCTFSEPVADVAPEDWGGAPGRL